MKGIIIKLIFLLVVSNQCYCQVNLRANEFKKCTIKGRLEGVKDGTVSAGYFDFDEKRAIIIDSSQIKNGKFLLKGKINGATMIVIVYKNIESNPFFIDAGENKIFGSVEGHGGSLKILFKNPNSPSYKDQLNRIKHDEEIYNNIGKSIYDKYRLLDSLISNTTIKDEESIYLKNLRENYNKCALELDKYHQCVDSMQGVYVSHHPNSYYTAFNYCFAVNRDSPEIASRLYNLFSEKVKNGIYGQYIFSVINRNKTFLKSKAPEFSTIDLNGDSIKLVDFRGKFVILEFWASWCKPCRATHPELRNLFELYHKNGLEIISLSSDYLKDIDKWKAAIMKDSIDRWNHILLNDRDEVNISHLYNVDFLPTKVLIDSDGNIVRKYNSSEFELLKQDLKVIYKF
ncbi:MAG: TlpA disulfide reductase family protein [Saprospiraceae bacterium]